jgi:hypothetical protein
MRCPGCNAVTKLRKARLDVYWCPICEGTWLIHKLSRYKTFEEASETNYETQLKKDFLEPLTVPPKGR